MNIKEVYTKLLNNQLSYYNFYNVDIDIENITSAQFYLEHPEDTIEFEQILNITFIDIEVFLKDFDSSKNFDVTDSNYPINAVTIYNTVTQTFYCYFLKHKSHTEEQIETITNEYFLSELKNKQYITMDENVEFCLYEHYQEIQMLTDIWNKIYTLGTHILSGFYSDKFDYPYIYNRLFALIGEDRTIKLLSTITNVVKYNNHNNTIDIFDYVILDLQRLYKKREDGGLNYGTKLKSYSLDYVSEIELGLKKFEYKNNNIGLDEFYINDPLNFFLYNICDVALCVRLNEKLEHIKIHNINRRKLKAPLTKATIGNSISFEIYVIYNMLKTNTYVRCGLIAERTKYIEVKDMYKIPKPNTKKGIINPMLINNIDYATQLYRFDGAFVKAANGMLILDGLIIDSDAKALYPTMIAKSNISFDTYVGKILPPTTYKFIGFLKLKLTGTPIVLKTISGNLWDLISNYIEAGDITPKSNNKRNLYYITMYLLMKLSNSGYSYYEIVNPIDTNSSILLLHYLIPLLTIVNNISPNKQDYNELIYDYIFNDYILDEKYETVYIIINTGNSNQQIIEMDVQKFTTYVKDYIVTITGTLFFKHSDKLGLFFKLLEELKDERDKFKKLRDNSEENSEEYKRYDMLQLMTKILMNTIYGIYGLKNFLFSDVALAESITTEGKMCLKIAQHETLKYLNEYYKK